MRNLKLIAFNTLLIFLLMPVLSWAELGKKSPEAAVKILLNEIKQIVEGDEISEDQKVANTRHSNIALSILKVSEISQKALGKYWAKHSTKQQDQFKNLLGELFMYVAFPSSAKFFADLDLVYGTSKRKKDMIAVPLTVIHEKEGAVVSMEVMNVGSTQGSYQYVMRWDNAVEWGISKDKINTSPPVRNPH